MSNTLSESTKQVLHHRVALVAERGEMTPKQLAAMNAVREIIASGMRQCIKQVTDAGAVNDGRLIAAADAMKDAQNKFVEAMLLAIAPKTYFLDPPEQTPQDDRKAL